MTDTITESFCERCGMRYAFEAAAKPRRAPFGRVRVLTRGVTTFISNDGMPMGEAMAAARSDEERAELGRQLDVFHKTFNFCMGCRQYTCASCWNVTTGECLTCSPDLTREVLPAAFPDLPISGPEGTNGEGRAAAAAMAWPSVDLDRGAGSGPAEPLDAPATEAAVVEAAVVEAAAAPPFEAPVVEDAAVEDAAVEDAAVEPALGLDLTPAELAEVEGALAADHAASAAPVEASAAEIPVTPPAVEPPAPADASDRAAAGRGQTRGLLRRFRPGAAAAVAAQAGDPAPADAVVAAAAPVEAAAVEAEPPTVATPAELEAVLAAPVASVEPTPQPALEPAPEPAPAPQPDAIAQPTWRMVAPDTQDQAAQGAPGAPAAESPPEPTAWPEAPAWPAASPSTPPRAPAADAAPWAARLSLGRPESTGIWAASSREVLSAPAAPAAAGVQACVSCGLSLSATARFCRRCGSRQG